MRWLVWNWKLKVCVAFMGEVEGTINEGWYLRGIFKYYHVMVWKGRLGDWFVLACMALKEGIGSTYYMHVLRNMIVVEEDDQNEGIDGEG